MPRPKTRTPELRDRVLQAALGTLAVDGVEGLTTRRVAALASTSTPAVYELFGDKAGLLRELSLEGFRLLRRHYDDLTSTDDALGDVVEIARLYRSFVAANRHLVRVMFSQAFVDFTPSPADVKAAGDVRELIVGGVQRAIDAGEMAGDATDIAHGLLALMIGLGDAEAASRLGRSRASVDRRWELAIRALLRGYAPPGGGA